MKKPLLTICYVSTSVGRLSENDVELLLEQSRARNSLDGVTGLLLYSDGNFMQYLEGKPEGLEPIWESIQRDPRHKNVSAVFKNTASIRVFENWSMAYKASMPIGFESLIRCSHGPSTGSPHAATIVRLLESFWTLSWSRGF
jgi:hypothetical protein